MPDVGRVVQLGAFGLSVTLLSASIFVLVTPYGHLLDDDHSEPAQASQPSAATPAPVDQLLPTAQASGTPTPAPPRGAKAFATRTPGGTLPPTLPPLKQSQQPRPEPTSSPSGGLDVPRWQLESRLLEKAPTGKCESFTGQGSFDPFAFGALAAISCDDPEASVKELALYQFADKETLTTYFTYRTGEVRERLPERTDACTGGQPGVRSWTYGRVACWVATTGSRTARVRWTDERDDTSGILDGSSADLRQLLRWWSSKAR
jgi:hypothetical protein